MGSAVQVIENETFRVPSSTQTYQLRSQDPHCPYGGPMLQLLAGHYPAGPDQVALTPGLASDLNVRVGGAWSEGGQTGVGIVQNRLYATSRGLRPLIRAVSRVFHSTPEWSNNRSR